MSLVSGRRGDDGCGLVLLAKPIEKRHGTIGIGIQNDQIERFRTNLILGGFRTFRREHHVAQ